ncbi:MAG: hypothetical protein H8E44_18695, partial [Planctomycetes bacterium]|nr:hypothetical protein [Planctomycetota bacterium]
GQWRAYGMVMMGETVEDGLAMSFEDPEEGIPIPLTDEMPDFGDDLGPMFGETEGELVEPFASMTLDEFDAAWKVDLNVSSQPAAEVLEELVGDLGLSLDRTECPDSALAKQITLRLPGCSRLRAIEEACRAAGLYPSYGKPEPSEDSFDFGFDEEPQVTTVTLKPGDRPYPVAFAGPLMVEVQEVERFPPRATGTLKLAIHAFALPPVVKDLLADQGEKDVTVEEVTGPDGHDLWDDERFSGTSWSLPLVPLKNLFRGLGTIGTVRGSLQISMPTNTAELQLAKLQPGTSEKSGDVQVTLASMDEQESCDLSIYVLNLGADEITWEPQDAQGQPLDIGGTSSFSLGNRAELELSVDGRPAVLVAKIADGAKSVRFDKLEPGEKQDINGGRIGLTAVNHSESCALEFQIKGAGDAVRIIPRDAQGDPMPVELVGEGSFGDERSLDLVTEGKPASATVNWLSAVEKIQYEFLLKDIPLGSLQMMPEKLPPLRFDGHETPVTVEFAGVAPHEHFPDSKVLKLRAINHSNKDIRRLYLRLTYLDGDGNKLKESPHDRRGTLNGDTGDMIAIVAKDDTAEFDMRGPSIAEGMKDVQVMVREIGFADATVWPPEPQGEEIHRKETFRTWASRDGQFTVKAAYVRLKDDAVELKKQDGSVIAVPLEKLSDADQQYARQQATPGAKPE